MVSDVVIRALNAANAAEHRRGRLEQLEADPDAFGETIDEASRVPLDLIAARLSIPADEGCVFGAFDGDWMIGTAGWFRLREIKTSHKGKVWGVYVDAQYRGRGIGRALMTSLLDAVKTIMSVEQLTLSVSTKQTAAIALYQSIGFEKIGRETRALKIGDRYADEDLMVLRLR